MAKFSTELTLVVNEYKEVEKNKNRIEDKTAYLITNSKYYENVRHTLSHLMVALELEIEDDPANNDQIKEQYIHARKHMSDLDINGYEYLAGYFLTESLERIENAGLFYSVGKSQNLRNEAVRHFDKGRGLRVAKKDQGMKHFEKCIDLCMEAETNIIPATKLEIRYARLALWSFIISIIAIITAIVIGILT